ncbi:MAG: hypothetical protein OXG08_11175 [Gammaproteobacteria bacterium]|nr:hypothetical protein [Gammaproteobacteria bacterium]
MKIALAHATVALVFGSTLAEEPHTVLLIENSEHPLDRVLEQCADKDSIERVVDGLDDRCFSAMDDYFLTRNAWRHTNVDYFGFARRREIHRSIFSGHLPVSWRGKNARLVRNAPRWQDIFDGDETSRADMVLGVLEDQVCAELAFDTGPLRIDLRERCQARELFKYAAYLDACRTANERYTILNSWFSQEQVIEAKIEATWLVSKCGTVHVAAVDSDLRPFSRENSSVEATPSDEFLEAEKNGYDAALSIAANVGDTWAIHSRRIVLDRENSAYWQSLFELNPALVHRMLAWSATDILEEVWHAAQAYEFDRQTRGSWYPGLREFIVDNFRSIRPSKIDDVLSCIPEQDIIQNNDVIPESAQFPWRTQDAETSTNVTSALSECIQQARQERMEREEIERKQKGLIR